MQCDIRFFATDARYGVVQVRRGGVGDAYSHWVLPRLPDCKVGTLSSSLTVNRFKTPAN